MLESVDRSNKIVRDIKKLSVPTEKVKSIKDLEPIKSQEILSKLYKQSCDEKYIYRHKWSQGDLVVWDNRCVLHYAEHGYGDKKRTMHRITTAGSKPF